jgi:hypothetical protein
MSRMPTMAVGYNERVDVLAIGRKDLHWWEAVEQKGVYCDDLPPRTAEAFWADVRFRTRLEQLIEQRRAKGWPEFDNQGTLF